MIIYNAFTNKIINLDNVIKIGIVHYGKCIDIEAVSDKREISVVNLYARTEQEKEQAENTANNLLKEIFVAMSLHKNTFTISEDEFNSTETDNYIGLTD